MACEAPTPRADLRGGPGRSSLLAFNSLFLTIVYANKLYHASESYESHQDDEDGYWWIFDPRPDAVHHRRPPLQDEHDDEEHHDTGGILVTIRRP